MKEYERKEIIVKKVQRKEKTGLIQIKNSNRRKETVMPTSNTMQVLEPFPNFT